MHPLLSLSSSLPDFQIWKTRVPYPLPSDLGRWLIENKLFASGNDFTSPRFQDPTQMGTSLLNSLWRGDPMRLTKDINGLDLLIISHSEGPCGVAAWLHGHYEQEPLHYVINDLPSHPLHRPKQAIDISHLGQVMVYLEKPYRGQGWMKQALKQWAPEWDLLAGKSRDQGKMPVLAAVDATVNLVRETTTLPVVSHLDLCQRLQRDVWGLWRESSMYHSEEWIHEPWIVAPQNLVKTPRTRPRMK
jgi:hypothetical protein